MNNIESWVDTKPSLVPYEESLSKHDLNKYRRIISSLSNLNFVLKAEKQVLNNKIQKIKKRSNLFFHLFTLTNIAWLVLYLLCG